MVSTTDTYSKYLDRLKAKDPTVLLGSLCWYTVAEQTRIDHPALVTLLKSVGLGDFTPPEPSDEDVFRRVCTSHQRKKVETDDPDVFENYLLRDVVRAEGRVVKQIVVEQVDKRGEKLSHEAAVVLEFESASSKLTVQSLLRTPNRQAMNVAELIRRDFKAERGAVNAYTLRQNVIREVIMSTHATAVRPTGGVYFVMQKHATTIEALSKFAAKLEGVTFHPVPLINDADQAAMLREAIENETREQIIAALDEIDKMMDGPEITSNKYAKMVEQMNAVKSRTVEYADLLDDALAGCNVLVKSYDAKMRKLFNHVNV